MTLRIFVMQEVAMGNQADFTLFLFCREGGRRGKGMGTKLVNDDMGM